MTTLNAYITIDGAAKAIDFYKAAFGAEEVMRMPSENDPGKLMHAEIKVFGNSVMMSDDFGMDGFAAPGRLGTTTFNLIAGLDTPADVDAAMARAEKAGATVVTPAADMFWGDRFGMVKDPFGHAWAFNAPLKK
ncbi:MAG: VOC family protein [Alphaproteobacteria bacterium]|nr:VOC family protein [Alphaproteobacteria bacterium]